MGGDKHDNGGGCKNRFIPPIVGGGVMSPKNGGDKSNFFGTQMGGDRVRHGVRQGVTWGATGCDMGCYRAINVKNEARLRRKTATRRQKAKK